MSIVQGLVEHVAGFECSLVVKTFIYCEQLCNNAVNYPSTPLNIM
jgi:hypothetical protein